MLSGIIAASKSWGRLSELLSIKVMSRTLSEYEIQFNYESGNISVLFSFIIDDLLCLLIDVYKRSGNCLPTAGEVEICNNNTSLEKVTLDWLII